MSIKISSKDTEQQKTWKGWVESRLRNFVNVIADATLDTFQVCPFPKMFQVSDCENTVFIGMNSLPTVIVPGEPNRTCDISTLVTQFKTEIVEKCPSFCDGMTVEVAIVRPSKLPAYCFPDGIVPASKPRAKKRTSSELDNSSDDSKSPCSPTSENESKRVRVDTTCPLSLPVPA
jgi:poly(A) polymerase